MFENSFIESLKDAFLSSNSKGQEAKMQQLRGGMDRLPKAFCDRLGDNITFGARVTRVEHPEDSKQSGNGTARVAKSRKTLRPTKSRSFTRRQQGTRLP